MSNDNVKSLSERIKWKAFRLHPADRDSVVVSKATLDRWIDEIAALEQRLEAAEAENMTAKLSEPDGKLHDDGCFTWNRGKEPADRRNYYAGWRTDFYLPTTVAALEQRLAAAETEKQQAIDAAFEHVAGLFDRVGKHDEAGFLRSWRGTNPLAERDARIAELGQQMKEAVEHISDQDDELELLERELAEARATIEKLRVHLGRETLAAEQLAKEVRELAEAKRRADWFENRCNTLQLAQTNMRDPERKMVCDILANGKTYETPVKD